MTNNSLMELSNILKEVIGIIEAVEIGDTPRIRTPIIDELYGFSLLLKDEAKLNITKVQKEKLDTFATVALNGFCSSQEMFVVAGGWTDIAESSYAVARKMLKESNK